MIDVINITAAIFSNINLLHFWASVNINTRYIYICCIHEYNMTNNNIYYAEYSMRRKKFKLWTCHRFDGVVLFVSPTQTLLDRKGSVYIKEFIEKN